MEMEKDEEDEAEAKTFMHTLKICGSYRIVHCSTVMRFAHSTFPYSAFTSDEKHQQLRLTTTTVHCLGDSDSTLSPYRRWQRILLPLQSLKFSDNNLFFSIDMELFPLLTFHWIVFSLSS